MFPRFNGLCNALALNGGAVATMSIDAVEQLAKSARQMAELGTYITEYLLSYCVPFEAGRDDDDDQHFYMEREWRVFDDVVFAISDIEQENPRTLVKSRFGVSSEERSPSQESASVPRIPTFDIPYLPFMIKTNGENVN